jgi:hypothetical protein
MKTQCLSLLIGCLFCFSYQASSLPTDNMAEKTKFGSSANKTEKIPENLTTNNDSIVNSNNSERFETKANQPRTVRDFFNLLPQKYFLLEGCEPSKDKNCNQARNEYIKNYLEIEDTANGYWKSGCDGAQSCLTMALFKRPNASYIVGLHVENEAQVENYFLEYKGGKWFDISARVIPQFSKKNIYELPQKGTTIEVFKKKFPEPDYSEKGAKLYNLVWKNGRFSINK